MIMDHPSSSYLRSIPVLVAIRIRRMSLLRSRGLRPFIDCGTNAGRVRLRSSFRAWTIVSFAVRSVISRIPSTLFRKVFERQRLDAFTVWRTARHEWKIRPLNRARNSAPAILPDSYGKWWTGTISLVGRESCALNLVTKFNRQYPSDPLRKAYEFFFSSEKSKNSRNLLLPDYQSSVVPSWRFPTFQLIDDAIEVVTRTR